MSAFYRLLTTTIIVLLIGTSNGYPQDSIPVADHHLHIRSDAASSALVELQKELSGNEIPQLPATGADQIIQLLDDGGIEKASLLSVAYFFGAPDISFPEEYQKVKEENNYVAEEAAKYPDRLAVFCSINPLADYAREEIQRCSELPQVAGLKLHFANSDVQLRNEEHLRKLARVFQQAAQLELSVIVHLYTRNPDYGRKDAEIFLKKVLMEVPDLFIQIAHLGGAGIYDDTTEEVIEYFRDAANIYPDIMDEDVVFDISATVANPEIARSRGDTTRAKEIEKSNQSLIEKIEELDANRLLFGTDWIAISRKPEEYAKLFRSLSLTSSTLEEIFKNKAPYFD